MLCPPFGCCSCLPPLTNVSLADATILRLKLTAACLAKAPSDPVPGTVVRRWDKTYSCYGSRQTLTSPSDSVLCLMRIARARFLSDTTECVTAEPDQLFFEGGEGAQICWGGGCFRTTALEAVQGSVSNIHKRPG